VNDSTGYYACVNTTTGQLATSTTACGASSERFKENITPLTYGLAQVLALRPVSFDYKASYIPNSTKQLGFIAEEVNLLMPELVATDATGQIQGLDYPKFTSVIVKAVQEVNIKIDGMLAQISKVLTWFSDDGKFKVQNDICVDDTCVTKEQFKHILLQAGAAYPPPPPSTETEIVIPDEGDESITVTSEEETVASTTSSTLPSTSVASEETEETVVLPEEGNSQSTTTGDSQ
jgi:hypothetical protein